MSMRSNDFTYKFYRASNGAKTFWRWDVIRKSHSKAALKSGFLYGTAEDAKRRAEIAASRLGQAEKMGSRGKI